LDWARAKNILIILLFVLNMLLTGTIVSRAIGGGADRELYASVMRVLEERNIEIKCSFPKQITSSALLVYGDGTRFVEACAAALSSYGMVEMLGKESLRYTNFQPAEALNTSSEAALDAAIRRVLGEKGVNLSSFTMDYTTKSGNGDYFYQYILEYKGKLVFDSNINVSVTPEGGIEEITINYREITNATKDKLMKVMPAYQVILKNFNESGDVIKSINIGFMGQNTRENFFRESDEGAVWRLRLEDGSERFFEAVYGEEIYLYWQT
jgi:regulatory protein YycI of two-component signal transduction system YycFG